MWEVHSNDNYEYRQKICENFIICVRIGNFEKGTNLLQKGEYYNKEWACTLWI